MIDKYKFKSKMIVEAWNPFGRLSEVQRDRLRAFETLLRQFNRGINLISREDEPFVEEHHVLHCLALTHRAFPAGATVVDWGTGGGLPSIPLAVAFPQATFHAVDAVGKKVQAVRAMARRLELANLQAWHGRAEAWPGVLHYSVSRATAPLLDLWGWHVRARRPGAPPAGVDCWRPGLICLKGGDLREEIASLQHAYPAVEVETIPLSPLLARPYFADKYVLAVSEVEP